MTEPIILYGCAPEPLIHYLKALGVLRLIAEQLDPQVRSAWRGDTFLLETSKTRDEISTFFLNEYCPTPIVAPWNGSSGFYPSDKKQRVLIETLCSTQSSRLNSYRQTIEAARSIVGDREQQPKDEEKASMLRAARRTFPDSAVDWLDAAYVLGQEKPDYPPMLGSGGNDGRLDFTVNFIERLTVALPELLRTDRRPEDKINQSIMQLRAALFADGATPLEKAAVGQFHPAGVGGVNAEQGVAGNSFVNPWDFILALEGSLLMASATVRQLAAGARTRASFPFTVTNSSVGYGTATNNEKVRAEIWLPLWSRLSNYSEITHIFREGRVQFSQKRRIVRTGFDFARAIAELGVDRGIEAFQRYAFIERNGQANLATPLGKFEVFERPRARLIHQIDRWLDSFSRAASGDKVPPRFVRVQQRIEDSLFRLCESGSADHLREVLIGLGAAEAELANGEKFRDGKKLRPLAGLTMSWVEQCDDGSDEFSLAAALASIREGSGASLIRENIEPIKATEKSIDWTIRSGHAVWGNGLLEDNIAEILQRRSIDARSNCRSHPVLTSRRFTSLRTINAFLNHATDDARIEDLLRGLILINWQTTKHGFNKYPQAADIPSSLPRAYALLKLLFLPDGKLRRDKQGEIIIIKHEPAIVPLLRAGRLQDAFQIACQRLQSSGLKPAASEFHYDDTEGVRLAAALLIPVDDLSIRALAKLVLRDKIESQ